MTKLTDRGRAAIGGTWPGPAAGYPAALLRRRTFLGLAGVLALCATRVAVRAQPADRKRTLLSAPLELAGGWGSAPPEAVARVLTRAREACLTGLRLVSDRQPERLRVDNHAGGFPAVWLHSDPASTAWIIVDIGPADWCKLAYQFGHELGHVLCNSWDAAAKPRPPSQWLEEAMVEAFSIRGLGLLAASWERDPPFAGNAGFAASIRQYRGDLIEKYRMAAGPASAPDVAAWFRAHRATLESGFAAIEGPAVVGVLAVLEGDPACVEDLGAVNRWPARSGVPIEDYLIQWERSCRDVGASGRLPAQLRSLFRVG
jgi:hypothetical protein